MIPNHDGAVGEIKFVSKPSHTYRLNKEKAYMAGRTDGLAAVQQAVYLMLNVERYQYPIYSWNYGVELSDLFGQPTSHVCAKLPQRIRDALLQDDRIEAVDGFSIHRQEGRTPLMSGGFSQGKVMTVERKRGTIVARFTVHTKYGSFQEEKEVRA